MFAVLKRTIDNPTPSRTFSSRWLLFTVVMFGLVNAPAVRAQDAAPPIKDPYTEQHTKFAPGVVTVIPPAPHPEETIDGPLAMNEFLQAYPELAWDPAKFKDGTPNFDPRTRTLVEMAKQVVLRREIYCLEFSFKPLRQIYADVPMPGGRVQRKLIWYMVYRVRYRGGDLRPAADQVAGSSLYTRVESVAYQSRRFFPLITLSDHVSGTEYVDRIIPSATSVIAAREQITAPLYNTVEITRHPVPHSTDADAPGVWGVVTWTDVNPHIDFLSLSVSGLTNAFQVDGEASDAPYRRKMLKLNFYRPGDAMDQIRDNIRFGMPAHRDAKEESYILKKYDMQEALKYEWTYRLVN